jgi:hypothetical protein
VCWFLDVELDLVYEYIFSTFLSEFISDIAL